MKLVLLAGLVALVTGSAIPGPRNQNQYVGNGNNYERAADDDSNRLPVDQQPSSDEDVLNSRSGADNQYWLYTRLVPSPAIIKGQPINTSVTTPEDWDGYFKYTRRSTTTRFRPKYKLFQNNPNSPQVIVLGNSMSIWGSNYLGTRPIKVIVHEHGGNGNSEMNRLLTSAWLAVTDANVIVVDWRRVASGNYATAVNEAANIGRAVGTFLTWLINSAGGNWNNVHFTGLGVGSHIAGNAGRAVGGRPRRITGLDPMNASWLNNANAISQRDGTYVEIIHTQNTLSNPPQIGNVDFYPNGGRNQPGCSNDACSQSRSTQLFASTIRTNHLIGRQCMSVSDAQNSRCSGSIQLHMGNGILTKNAIGVYGLTTGSVWPF